MALTVLIPLTMSRMGSAVRPGVLSGMVEDLGLSLLANLEERADQPGCLYSPQSPLQMRTGRRVPLAFYFSLT